MKASEGYLLAKRQMIEALDHRLSVYEKSLKNEEDDDHRQALKVRIQEVEQFRNFIRNGMLWDTSQGE